MSESALHMLLVSCLVKWIADSVLGGESAPILTDASNRAAKDKPAVVYGYVPDVCVLRSYRDKIVIGEAKTARDVEGMHSMEQYKAFLRKCAECEDSLFVLAVPWDMVRLARSILCRLKNEIGAEGVTTKVLERLPGYG